MLLRLQCCSSGYSDGYSDAPQVTAMLGGLQRCSAGLTESKAGLLKQGPSGAALLTELGAGSP